MGSKASRNDQFHDEMKASIKEHKRFASNDKFIAAEPDFGGITLLVRQSFMAGDEYLGANETQYRFTDREVEQLIVLLKACR